MKRKRPIPANPQEPIELSPAVREFVGSIPPWTDLKALRDNHLREKYGLNVLDKSTHK